MCLSFKRTPHVAIGFLIASVVVMPRLSAQEPIFPAAHRAIVGWDDSVICVGPGTVAGDGFSGGDSADGEALEGAWLSGDLLARR